MTAGDAGVYGIDLATRHQFRLFNSPLNRLHGRFDIDHDAFLHPPRGVGADTDDLDLASEIDLADNRRHLVGADVQPNESAHFVIGRHEFPYLESVSLPMIWPMIRR